MSTPTTVPTWRVRLDAVERAMRTFFAGLAAYVVVATVPAVLVLLGTVKFTREWWTAALASLATIALNAVASYVARYVKTPNQGN